MIKIDHDERMLDILFRRIPPERLLRHVCSQAEKGASSLTKEDMRRIFRLFGRRTVSAF